MRLSPLPLLLLLLPASAGAVEPLGPMATAVSDSGVSIWARGPGRHMEVELTAGADTRRAIAAASEESDHTASVRFYGLAPGSLYPYRVRFAGETAPREGRFRTAPAADASTPLRVAFGGDVAGQNICRDRKRGFPIFTAIDAFEPDLFLALGDMIYADATCEEEGLYGNPQIPGDFPVSTTLEDFRAHWRYVRADAGLQRLYAHAAVTPIWDDHEVTNDFGPQQGGELVAPGRRAYIEYNPTPGQDEAQQLYRSERWGQHAELFVLDTRSYRDANAAPDPATGTPKSMLGAEQERWLREALVESGATWKLVVSSVPLAIPTGSNAGQMGRDGWAGFDTDTGFERSLLALLAFLRDADVRNLLWLTTDVHFASVQRFRPFPEDPDFSFVEMVTGPLQSGLFARRRLDPTLNPERLFFHGPEAEQPPTRFEEALTWFNFGSLEIDAAGNLTLGVRGVDGDVLYQLALEPR